MIEDSSPPPPPPTHTLCSTSLALPLSLPVSQGLYNYMYPPGTPQDIIDNCTPEGISLLNAEQCLFYRYGEKQWVKYVWAIGLLAAGQSSTMTVSGWVWQVM